MIIHPKYYAPNYTARYYTEKMYRPKVYRSKKNTKKWLFWCSIKGPILVNTYRGWLNIFKSSLRFKKRSDFIREKKFCDKKNVSTLAIWGNVWNFHYSNYDSFEIWNWHINRDIKIYHQTFRNYIILSISSTRKSFWTK